MKKQLTSSSMSEKNGMHSRAIIMGATLHPSGSGAPGPHLRGRITFIFTSHQGAVCVTPIFWLGQNHFFHPCCTHKRG
ncbi:hypothetical protein TNCV_5012831 [Trichonephila clavipes]|nr:hypothetical protein TNCV_5012831 [Trichonephila clavipes]